MRIALVGYRQWALEIYDNISNQSNLSKHEFLRINSHEQFLEKDIVNFKPDYILFYGWSWIISETLINNFQCVMLHPSPLPKYRGGSPIQNQIINGETDSAVTLFLMDKGIDTGPIIQQESISLKGSLKEIFERIIEVGTRLTLCIFEDNFVLEAQDHSKATYYKRRNETESEITIEELEHRDSLYLYNKIRMLQEPYPRAFIKTADGKKLYINEAFIEK